MFAIINLTVMLACFCLNVNDASFFFWLHHLSPLFTFYQLIRDLFKGDDRQQAVIAHFNSKRQRSNAAKTVFATMTQDELKVGLLFCIFNASVFSFCFLLNV